jgi:hypothetical protein
VKTFYGRLGDGQHEWVAAEAARTGLSMSQIIDTVIYWAREDGWRVEAGRIRVISNVPAASPPVTGPRGQGQEPASSPPSPVPGPPGERT